jgi:hypothetical protein
MPKRTHKSSAGRSVPVFNRRATCARGQPPATHRALGRPSNWPGSLLPRLHRASKIKWLDNDGPFVLSHTIHDGETPDIECHLAGCRLAR